MKVVVMHGQSHKKNTYRLTHMLLDQLNCAPEDIKEYVANGTGHCVGCTKCILEDEHLCPHREQIAPIVDAIDEADVIIFDSPNYCMGMSGQLKSFFDHMAYRWISHRPNPDMRSKIGIAVSTTAGAGAGKTTKAIREQFIWWAVGRTYMLPFTIAANSMDELNEKKKRKRDKKVQKLANKINHIAGSVKPSIKIRTLFMIMTKMHDKIRWSEIETKYWKEKGLIR